MDNPKQQSGQQATQRSGLERLDALRQRRGQMIDEANADIDSAFGRGKDKEQLEGQQTAGQPAPYQLPDADGRTPSEEGAGIPAAVDAAAVAGPVIGKEQIRKARHILKKYRDGKRVLEHNIVINEKWFKKRHWDLMTGGAADGDPKPSSAWLFNTIASKHADFMDNTPMVDILPREANDQEEAERLSSIVPVVLDENDFEDVYSAETWYKLKHGTGVYGVFWDAGKLHGLGDIDVECMDILNLFWEPGVTDIQKSANFFNVELVDNDILVQTYPELKGKLRSASDSTVQKYWYDENIDTQNKSAVIDWYYKKMVGGRQTVQYCKFVGEEVIYATENDVEAEVRPRALPKYDKAGNPARKKDGSYDYNVTEEVTRPSMAETGLYDHGMYPFVFDPLFPEAGMPTGFGFVQLCKSTQASIDVMNNMLEKNMAFTASPRFLVRNDGSINQEEFADPNTLLIHTDGNLGQDSIVPVTVPQMVSGNYIELRNEKIDEMKETSGNRDVSSGGTTGGVTSASGIAAMQEAGSRLTRDMTKTTYRAYKKVVKMVIELIRQFYDMPRQFRIIGKNGEMEFINYDNSGLKQQEIQEFGVDMSYNPEFDLKVSAEKQSPYARTSQNDLALQFYNNGFFNPQYADQALAALDMMDFDGKQPIMEKIQMNGGMYQEIMNLKQQLLEMAQIVDSTTGSNMSESVAADINGQVASNADALGKASASIPKQGASESGVTRNARQRTAEMIDQR